MTWFQSHNGAIAAVVAHAKTLLKLRFQSHNGAIAAVEGLETLFVCGRVSIPQWCDCCFKSVRMTGEMTMFQSHNGAIAALRVREFVSVSTAVSIPQWCDCCDTTPCAVTSVGTSFNPTMVRLLPFILPSPPKFRWCFNPTMVRLLLLVEKVEGDVLTVVSIPQWCDCCLVIEPLSSQNAQVSIPQWCDCCCQVAFSIPASP